MDSVKLVKTIQQKQITLSLKASVKTSITPLLRASKTVKQVSHATFLGIILGENLNGTFHIDQTCSKLS